MLTDLFVHNPAVIFLVAGFFFAGYLLARRSAPSRQAKWLLLPAVAWTLWAAWELGIVLFSPEANIRIDLLLIIPVVLLLSIVGIVMVFVPRRPSVKQSESNNETGIDLKNNGTPAK